MPPALNGLLLASLGAPSHNSLSLWSEDSFLSIASKGSALSIGSVGSFASAGSIMSARARDSIMGDPERPDAALLSAGILALCAAAVAGWAIHLR